MIKMAELFKGCITALAANGTFNGLIAGRVYTRVPRSPAFPFVRIISLPTIPNTGFLNAFTPEVGVGANARLYGVQSEFVACRS